MEATINTDDVLNFTAHCDSYIRVGIVKAIMYQMTVEELDKLKSILSHAHGRHEAKTRNWKGPRSSQEDVGGTVALDKSMIALPVIPEHFDFYKLTKRPFWWKNFWKSQFLAIDVECVQHKDFVGPFKDKAAIVSVVDSKQTVFTERITWPSEKIVINAATRRINGITPESLSLGKSFKIVKEEVARLLKNKIVITVGGSKDFRSLELDETLYSTFDLQQFYYRIDPNNQYNMQGMSLRDMYFYHFFKDCQQGTHSATLDAKNTLRVFLEGYASKKFANTFWDDNGNRKIDFDDATNLKSLEKRGVVWSEEVNGFINK